MIRDVRVRRLRAVVPGICLAVALPGTLDCESFGPHVYRVPSRGMEPTIKSGALVLVMRWPPSTIKVQRDSRDYGPIPLRSVVGWVVF